MNPSEDPSALLPWYLNGTLREDERRDIEAWLLRSGGAEEQLTLWRAVQREVSAEPLPAVGGELGWRRLRAQLPRSGLRPWWLAAAAGVLMIVGLQSAILMRDAAQYRPLSEPRDTQQWVLHLRFAPYARMSDVSEWLSRQDAVIVSGPSALGLYTVAWPREAASSQADLLDRLRDDPLLQEAAP